METKSDVDVDDDFSEIYKEYTGPLGNKINSADDMVKQDKRSQSEEDEETRDPNAVPTDFTSREAKVWEAKSKATERNWKKRKEEEMICKICGESGHFTQGCPSTLGANRKSQDFFERVAARESHVKALFTEKVIQRIEKDIGCKIKMEEKFIIVSGKSRLILAKGVDAVHKVIKGEGDLKGSYGSHRSRSRCPQQSPTGSRFRRSDSQSSYLGHSRDTPQYQQRFGRQDKVVEDCIHENVQKFSRDSSQAYGNDGGRNHTSHSKSPVHPRSAGNPYGSHVSRNNVVAYRTDGWDAERRGFDLQSGHQFEYSDFPHTYEELEIECKREATELGRIYEKEEDEENYKHSENIKEIRDNYTKKLNILRSMHRRQWQEFLQIDAQRLRQRAHELVASSGFGGYKQHGYSDYDSSATNHYAGPNLLMDSRARYLNHLENYSSRPHETYNDFQRTKSEDFGKYNRY